MNIPVSFTSSRGAKLSAILSKTQNSNNLVIMAHGFSSNKNTKNFVALAELLEQRGIASLRFDAYGHGESEGNFEDITLSEGIDDILCALTYAKSLGYTNLGLLGSSFGGFCSILAASQSRDLQFLMLKSPVSDYLALEKARYSDEQLRVWKDSKYIDYADGDNIVRLGYTFMEDMEKHNSYLAASLITVPTLIVHGTLDTDVPFAQSEKLVTLIPHATLIPIQGADHRYTKTEDAESMIREFLSFAATQFSAQ